MPTAQPAPRASAEAVRALLPRIATLQSEDFVFDDSKLAALANALKMSDPQPSKAIEALEVVTLGSACATFRRRRTDRLAGNKIHKHSRHCLKLNHSYFDGLRNRAALLGAINVVLVVRRSIWNYPFGIAMVALYFFVFWDAKPYSDALLHILLLLLIQVYGWWAWKVAAGRSWRRRRMDALATAILWLAVTMFFAIVWGAGNGPLHGCRRALRGCDRPPD